MRKTGKVETSDQANVEMQESSDSINSGFDESFDSSTTRMMNKDGSVNVIIKGLSRFKQFNLYKQLIELPTLPFYSLTLLLYILINGLFATIYFSIGLDGLNATTDQLNWFDAFFFSTQTFTTVGFGHISPSSMLTNVVASLEAFLGLLFFAIATGLVYGRFTNSKAIILFSDKMIISTIEKERFLMVRLTSASSTELGDLEAKIIMSYIIKKNNGTNTREYKNLKLDLPQINLLTTSWTISHKIIQDSPCNLLSDSSAITGVEFMLFITAFDEVFDQTVKVRTSYVSEDIVHDVKFVPITSYNEESIVVDLDKLSEIE